MKNQNKEEIIKTNMRILFLILTRSKLVLAISFIRNVKRYEIPIGRVLILVRIDKYT